KGATRRTEHFTYCALVRATAAPIPARSRHFCSLNLNNVEARAQLSTADGNDHSHHQPATIVGRLAAREYLKLHPEHRKTLAPIRPGHEQDAAADHRRDREVRAIADGGSEG